jgi:hypothetical protein
VRCCFKASGLGWLFLVGVGRSVEANLVPRFSFFMCLLRLCSGYDVVERLTLVLVIGYMVVLVKETDLSTEPTPAVVLRSFSRHNSSSPFLSHWPPTIRRTNRCGFIGASFIEPFIRSFVRGVVPTSVSFRECGVLTYNRRVERGSATYISHFISLFGTNSPNQ